MKESSIEENEWCGGGGKKREDRWWRSSEEYDTIPKLASAIATHILKTINSKRPKWLHVEE